MSMSYEYSPPQDIEGIANRAHTDQTNPLFQVLAVLTRKN